MTIPEVMEEMRALASVYGLPRLTELAAELRRRQGKKGAITSRPMCDPVKNEIWVARQDHPEWSQQMIAEHVGVNSGRVSEVLHGKRK